MLSMLNDRVLEKNIKNRELKIKVILSFLHVSILFISFSMWRLNKNTDFVLKEQN